MALKQCLPILLLLAAIQSFKLVPFRTAETLALSQLQAAQLGPGRGFSTDRQQISSIICFNVNASPYSKTESVVRLDQGASFSEIQKSLKVDVSAKVGISIFSIQADVNYLKEIKDSEMAMSFSYYQFVQSEMTIESGYGPAGALTMDGLRAYGSAESPNPRFGLICGDRFISSFKVGANLVFSMKLQFQSHSEKNSFQAKLGVKFVSFLSISADIQRAASASNIVGKVEIMAYQSGGNPAQLAKILNSTCGSSYCAATCSMLRMNDCMGAVNGLIKYASSNFPNQVNLNDPKTLSPYSIGFADLQDIKWLGLNIPASYATKQVVAMREKIADSLFKHQYYIDKISSLVQSKIPWDKNSFLYSSMMTLNNLCKSNINLIMDQTSGGILCFKDPQSCVSDGNFLLTKLKPIDSYVTFLISSMKYKIVTDVCGSEFIPYSDIQWFCSQYDHSKCSSLDVKAFNVTGNHLFYNLTINASDTHILHTFFTVGSLTAKSDIAPFMGNRQEQWQSNTRIITISVPREISEYAFSYYIPQ